MYLWVMCFLSENFYSALVKLLSGGIKYIAGKGQPHTVQESHQSSGRGQVTDTSYANRVFNLPAKLFHTAGVQVVCLCTMPSCYLPVPFLPEEKGESRQADPPSSKLLELHVIME